VVEGRHPTNLNSSRLTNADIRTSVKADDPPDSIVRRKAVVSGEGDLQMPAQRRG
jgi:hypothetical protein